MKWRYSIRYEWQWEIVKIAFGDHLHWKYYRSHTYQDQYIETMDDLIGLYCMGGEL